MAHILYCNFFVNSEIRKYILVLFIGFTFWSCEHNDNDNELKLTFTSVMDGETINSNSGLLLRFSDKIPDNVFDATSIETFNTENTDLIDYMHIVKFSNYFTLNNQPLTFLYNSKTSSCLFIPFTDESNPNGTGEGFIPTQGNNQIKIGDEKINFIIEEQNNSGSVSPNPKVLNINEAEENRRVLFSNFNGYTILDIYLLENKDYNWNANYERRLLGEAESENIYWDLKDFNNSEITSGFYLYRLGVDTLDNGYLNYETTGFFSIIKED